MSSAEGKLDNERKSSVGQHVLQAETQDVYDKPALNPVYQAKAWILNDALQDIGMGQQVPVFICASFMHLTYHLHGASGGLTLNLLVVSVRCYWLWLAIVSILIYY